MKIIGATLIGIGLALLLFVGYNYLTQEPQFASPVPQQSGVKVIIVTPSK
jgi:hypothetical protein